MDFAADVALAFVDDGIDVTYTVGADAPVPCRVMVDRAVQIFDNLGQCIGRKTVITFQAAQVPAPVRGAIVAAVAPATGTWKLDRVEEDDGYTVRVVTQ